MKINPTIASIESVAISPLKYEGERAPVTKEIKYVNNLGIDVMVLDRRGVEFKIPSRFNPSSRSMEFKIVESYVLMEGVHVNLSDEEKDTDIECYRQKILESLEMDSKASRTTRKAIVETVLKKTDLTKYDNAVYIKEHDIVVYMPKVGVTIIHPTTVSLVLNGLTPSKRNVEGFTFIVRINDPKNRIGNRYLNISGVVYEIVPERNPTNFEGAIISSVSGKNEMCHVPMSLDEFEEKIKSYKTYEEAEVFGNMEEKMKQQLSSEIETLKHSNSVESERLKSASLKQQQESDDAKRELVVMQTELKAQEAKHKKELELISAQIDKEKTQMEFQSLQRKAYYEERSYDRKDSSELIKFLPMVIGAGLDLLFK